ncbi:TAFII55 protein conserved region-domain-containing protein [Kalaharituber pfeilii]|nr:TAFII55 protein conserved region-domain-containing protein [Kalaharituber pfeilii]
MIRLKINTSSLQNQNKNDASGNSGGSGGGGGGGSRTAASAASPAPASAGGGEATTPATPVVPKIRFKNLNKTPSSASKSRISTGVSASKVTKPGAVKGPSLKLKPIITNQDALNQAEELASNGASIPGNANSTPITIKTPKLKLKANGVRPKKRHFEPGLGYDSEASDREEDPAIEEQFILRMKPGPDCEYLRHMIEMRQLDQNTNVWFKFKDNRKAVVCINGNLYSALLVDLPCIIESSKTLDKKAIFKTADICQMLLVGDRIPNEEAVHNTYHKSSDIIYPHGLTPPLQYVRKRRFRKRVSNRTIEAVEAEVDRLLSADQEAESVKYELIDAQELLREESYDGTGGYDILGQAGGDGAAANEEDAMPAASAELQGGDGYNDEDAEGEEDYEMDEDDLAMQMESALMGEDADADGEIEEGDMLAALNGTAEDAVANGASAMEEESEEDDEDGDDEDGEGEMDENAQESAQQNQKIREEIADLEAAYKAQLRELEKAQNPIIKARKQTALEKIINELEFKRNTLTPGGATL